MDDRVHPRHEDKERCMNWADIKPWVAKVAPMLGAALGGPLGGAAGALIGNALGIKDATPESIATAIKTGTLDADHIVALKLAEEEFTLKAQAMGYDNIQKLEELAFKDRDSARDREKIVKDKIPAILAIGVTIGFFTLLIFLLKWAPPSDNKDVMNIMLGSLGTAWISIISYYFGSSAGSAKKDDIMRQDKLTP